MRFTPKAAENTGAPNENQTKQVTRDNHYVPQWYQRGFMPKGRHKLFVRNLQPGVKKLPNGQALAEPELEELGQSLPSLSGICTRQDLARSSTTTSRRSSLAPSTKLGRTLSAGGYLGIRLQIHRRFEDFFGYLDAQKLRTPKGLDWILKHYAGLQQLDLMLQMQALRQMHCAMWSECVREIVSASKATVKFLVSDHPVTVFNPKMDPTRLDAGTPASLGFRWWEPKPSSHWMPITPDFDQHRVRRAP